MTPPIKTKYERERKQAEQELKILEDDVINAKKFFQENRKNYFQNKKNIPIYLILGPAHFGKTTILSQAGLDLVDFNNEKMNRISPTKYCSFWFSKNAIYIDSAGEYTKPDITKPRDDIIWQGFIKLLQKYFGKSSIAGVLIVLDLPAIAQSKDVLAKTLFCVRERIYEISSLVTTLNTHIVFSKCDCISGFKEFFSLLDTKQRLQPFGISFAESRKNNLLPFFEEKFDELIKQLNKQVISNCKKTTQPNDRPLIKMFPSQLNSIRQTIIAVIGRIPSSNQIMLSGIYFTSSIQKGAPINPIKSKLLDTLKLKEKATYNLESNKSNSYFVEKIFKETIVIPTNKNNSQKKLKLTNIYTLVVAIVIAATCSFLGYKNYQKNLEEINQIDYSLQYQDTGELYNLFNTANQAQKQSNSPWLKIGVNKVAPLGQALKKLHLKLFTKNLGAQLEGYLNTALESQGPIDNQKVYRGLQSYLMLGNPNKLNKEHLRNWFNNYWGIVYESNEQKEKLEQQLDEVLQKSFQLKLDKNLIESTRGYLNSLSTTQIMYVFLENKFDIKSIKFNKNNSVSNMYTREDFNSIYKQHIPNLVKNIPNHDWVLGNVILQTEGFIPEDVISELQNMYIENFVLAWKKAIATEMNYDLKELEKNLEYIHNILLPNSPLLKLLQQVKLNTNFKQAPNELTEEIKFSLGDFSEVDLGQLQKHLKDLSLYISDIIKSSNPNKTAFLSLTKYYQENQSGFPIAEIDKFAEKQPELLQNYLNFITDYIWQILFNSTKTYINKVWQEEVVQEYEKTIKDKYPIFKKGKEDIPLDDFNKFFDTNGIISNFFKTNISQFVNTEHANWTWKDFGRHQVEFSQETLETFLRASLIQKMFYSTKKNNPTAQFTLKPIAMTANVKNFTLHVDGQKVLFNEEYSVEKKLSWPGPQPGTVTMTFVNDQEKYFTTSKLGHWAWFKILDKSKINASSNPKILEVTFEIKDNVAKFKLINKDPANPFIPGVINKFRCQEQLS